MSFEAALRMTEILVSLALIQRGAEHLARGEWRIFGPQVVVALALMAGVWPGIAVWVLWALGLWQLHRFQGPYNGGSDKMVLLTLTCLAIAHAAPSRLWAEMALSYLAVQLALSYFISGWVKLRNPDWRSGRALSDVFAFSAYPVSEGLRALAGRRRLLWLCSWAVILFEVAFPLALTQQAALAVALGVAALFHLSNACFFGLNRFVWAWIGAYPALLWFQLRITGQGAEFPLL